MKTVKFIKLILILCGIIYMSHSFVYAKNKNFNEKEVEAPVAEDSNNISENIIYSKNKFEEYTPLNPVKPGIDSEEYESVNNFYIDLTTIETRIKYFSPTYTNIKSSAESSYWMGYYVRGGNDTLVYDYKSYTEDIYSVLETYKDAINHFTSRKNALDKNDAEYKAKSDALIAEINKYSIMYSNTKKYYDSTNNSISSIKSMLGLKNALYNIGNVDNNNKISYARRSITKAIKSIVLTYMQLTEYVNILEKQSDLYYDMYLLNKKNYELGTATAYDVSSSLDNYESVKSSLNSTKNKLKNVKEQIAINLGYKLSDIDKLVFVEPHVDLDYINNIDFDKDKITAYNSNSNYTSISLSDKDKRLPQSTGENLYHRLQEYMSSVLMAELENIYKKLIAKELNYESSLYLYEICVLNENSNKIKYETNLVSELEYNALTLQNLSNMLQVKVAKYDLINAINEYYYAVLGDITIE